MNLEFGDVGKIALLALAMVCVTVLAGVKILDGTQALGLIGTVVGYMAGNGVIARRGGAPSATIVPHHDDVAAAVEASTSSASDAKPATKAKAKKKAPRKAAS